jgi:hypothetical protein
MVTNRTPGPRPVAYGTEALMQTKELKKHSAQYDLFNRLHSINADAAFIRKVASRYPALPIVREFDLLFLSLCSGY